MTNAPPDFAALQAELVDLMDELGIPGLGVLVLEHAATLWSDYLGYAKIDEKIPVGAQTVFEAASLTKPLFAYVALKLVEDGLLDLDVPLDEYLPAPYLPDEPRSRLITARQVLCHTSGLPNWAQEGEPLQLEFPTGHRFAYSGEGYVYLQKVVEQISGQPIAPLLQTRMLTPLGLASAEASLVWEPEFDLTCATAYNTKQEPVDRERTVQGNVAYSLRCTPAAYGRFISRMLAPGTGDGHWLSPQTWKAMLTPVVLVKERGQPDKPPPPQIPGLCWGLGWGISEWEGRRLFWQWGDNEVFHSLAVGEPDTGRGLIAMTNSQSGLRLWPTLVRRVFGEPHPLLVWLNRYRA